MEKKFYTTIYALIAVIAFSCSTSITASAQSTYPPPPDNNGNYDNNQNYQDGNNNNNGNYDNNPSGQVDMNAFYDALSPYGTWMNYPAYGRVWLYNQPGFLPYNTGGHWVYSTFGWTWASDYAWGWAPFHYGRWAYDPAYGWMWIPGYEWGPAWVAWRTGGEYYGWAPLTPGFGIGIGLGFGGYIPVNNWYFAQRRYIGSPYLNRYYIPQSRNFAIIRNTTIINNVNIYRNTTYVTGPSRIEVERFTGQRISTVNISNASRPGSTRIVGNTMQMYRPQVARETGNRNGNATANSRAFSENRPPVRNPQYNTSRQNETRSYSNNNQSYNNSRVNREAQINEQNTRPSPARQQQENYQAGGNRSYSYNNNRQAYSSSNTQRYQQSYSQQRSQYRSESAQSQRRGGSNSGGSARQGRSR